MSIERERARAMWFWLADPTNQKTLALIGGEVSLVVGAGMGGFQVHA